ncbi:MAG: hypothetical protein IH991_14830 [Planctomycetes bacterium]|nr:hypothetical protein [Planctomycetota bacterium]
MLASMLLLCVPLAGCGDKLTIEIKSWDETQALVAKQMGKVVIIDMWSTT